MMELSLVTKDCANPNRRKAVEIPTESAQAGH